MTRQLARDRDPVAGMWEAEGVVRCAGVGRAVGLAVASLLVRQCPPVFAKRSRRSWPSRRRPNPDIRLQRVTLKLRWAAHAVAAPAPTIAQEETDAHCPVCPSVNQPAATDPHH